MEAPRLVRQVIAIPLTATAGLLSGAIATTGHVFTTDRATTTGNRVLLNGGILTVPRGFTFSVTITLGTSRFLVTGKDGWGRDFELEFRINGQAGSAAFTLPAKSISRVEVLFGNGATFAINENQNFGLKYPADFTFGGGNAPMLEAIGTIGTLIRTQTWPSGVLPTAAIYPGDGSWDPTIYPADNNGYGGQGIYNPSAPVGPDGSAEIWYAARRLDETDFRGPVV
jgi:hypothetical protein